MQESSKSGWWWWWRSVFVVVVVWTWANWMPDRGNDEAFFVFLCTWLSAKRRRIVLLPKKIYSCACVGIKTNRMPNELRITLFQRLRALTPASGSMNVYTRIAKRQKKLPKRSKHRTKLEMGSCSVCVVRRLICAVVLISLRSLSLYPNAIKCEQNIPHSRGYLTCTIVRRLACFR